MPGINSCNTQSCNVMYKPVEGVHTGRPQAGACGFFNNSTIVLADRFLAGFQGMRREMAPHALVAPPALGSMHFTSPLTATGLFKALFWKQATVRRDQPVLRLAAACAAPAPANNKPPSRQQWNEDFQCYVATNEQGEAFFLRDGPSRTA